MPDIKSLRALADVTDAAFQKSQNDLSTLRNEIADTQHEINGLGIGAELGDLIPPGQHAVWQSWVIDKQTKLEHRLAELRHLEAASVARLKVDFGRSEVAKGLLTSGMQATRLAAVKSEID